RLAPQLARLAADRRSLWLVLALALAVALPTLDAGLIGDDVAQQRFIAAQLDRPTASPDAGAVRWWDMFVLVEGEAERTLGMRLAGRYPWWVDPDLRIRFFRPLSVATHHVDHWLARALWPGSVWPMHPAQRRLVPARVRVGLGPGPPTELERCGRNSSRA